MEKKSELENQIIRIKSHLIQIEEKASERRQNLSSIFDEVRKKITEREQLLKKRISDMLDSERTLYK